jgi:hypothetical protein
MIPKLSAISLQRSAGKNDERAANPVAIKDSRLTADR